LYSPASAGKGIATSIGIKALVKNRFIASSGNVVSDKLN
jgi:hypothetical protein